MRLILWVLLALMIVAIVYLGVGLLVATLLSTPDRQVDNQTPADVGLEYRKVDLKSTDGLDLVGWWVPNNDTSRVVLLVPGLNGSKSEEHILYTAAVYARAGYGVLMVDLRGQGGSEGERVTMGYKEVRDVRGALLWLEKRGFSPAEVVLHGFSMGGATVLRAAPGTGVGAVVEESAYADLPLILRQRLPEFSGLPSLFNLSIMLTAKLFLGLDAWAVQPAEDARKLCEQEIPLLIIHSRSDEVVHFDHAQRIKVACPEAAFWQIEGVGHVEAYTLPEYQERLLGFLQTQVFEDQGH